MIDLFQRQLASLAIEMANWLTEKCMMFALIEKRLFSILHHFLWNRGVFIFIHRATHKLNQATTQTKMLQFVNLLFRKELNFVIKTSLPLVSFLFWIKFCPPLHDNTLGDIKTWRNDAGSQLRASVSASSQWLSVLLGWQSC